MTHPTSAGIGLVTLGESSFVPANPEDGLRGKRRLRRERATHWKRGGSLHRPQGAPGAPLGGGRWGFLGIGEKPLLVPVEAVTQVTEDRVTIEPERTRKVEGPAPFDTKVAPPPAAEERRAQDYASPPYGGTDRLDMEGYGPYGR
jgi:hypothetical protein